MIWSRLKKSTDEQEADFRERMSDPEVTWKDRLAMIISAFLVILIPCVLILLVVCFVAMWAFGIL